MTKLLLRTTSMKNTRGIIGAVIGDIAGSAREFREPARPGFKLFTSESTFTDDSVLTVAVADWLLHRDSLSAEAALLKWGREYPHAGYGRGFKAFLKKGEKNPNGSTHNGSAMRVSAAGFLAGSLDEAMELARESALPSHDTPVAVAGAQAIAAAVYLARTGASKEDIRSFISGTFGYDLSRSLADVRADIGERLELRRRDREAAHELLLSAGTTVPDALSAFLESGSYEEAVRNAVGLGGDADTYGAMAGAVAAAMWGVPEDIVLRALPYIPSDMLEVINAADGTSWEPTGITPPNTRRWRKDDIVVYGCDRTGTVGEQGFHDVRPSMFNRHPNSGYPIHTIGESPDSIREQVKVMMDRYAGKPGVRLLVREVGTGKAGYSAEEMAPMFADALHAGNVLLPKSFLKVLKGRR